MTQPTPNLLNSEKAVGALPWRSFAPRELTSSHSVHHHQPPISVWLLHWFSWYSRRFLRRHFHSLRISRAGLPLPQWDRPLVIFSNHASWWDPLVFLLLKNVFFAEYSAFAPMEATMLDRYKFFRRLGFFGVEQRSQRGAMQFLRSAEMILQSPRHLLALTPQARFADARERPVRFGRGLGHLARRIPAAVFLPVALEYVFWEERLPEVLVRFGKAIDLSEENRRRSDAHAWTSRFEQSLSETQDALALETQRRCPDDFEVLLRGGSGQGGLYDRWRALKTTCRGATFHRAHGSK